MDRRSPRLTEQVFDRLRDEIVRGVLPPGAPVIEADVSERLQVSRTPVREALIKLADEGLVRVFPQRGSFVAPISLQAVREAQFLREHLECAMVADAAAQMTLAGSGRLIENLDAQRRAARQDDGERFYRLDEELHTIIAEIAGHPRVWRVIQQEKVHMDRIRYLSFADHAHLERLIGQHQDVVEALVERNADRATGAMRLHLREVFGTIDKLHLVESSEPISLPPRRRRQTSEEKAARRGLPQAS
ncbi:GntR family transcriptional regulator [Rhodovastum atsumiense]|uniref:GntR family transcriptional regulator n=1 Tax=Rhodovastum atsumiense TaxID=504468 RepID=A0A5M6IT09_9PROT|nr:GntR family transcriptional regulator [Rhodovastum atsumiense]KAA5610698.1 GntR family transcriptional regulator [Rhodovastum atsumiense]CAH2603300.1 GntR family transcriptional regulator [Rhodovastum atsumiense]